MKTTLQEVSQTMYEESFNKIRDWFETQVYPDIIPGYTYKLIDLEKDYHKMYDIISDGSGGIHFRVIIRMTQENVNQLGKPNKNYLDLAHFEKLTEPSINGSTARQVFWVQLDANGEPVNCVIVTYLPSDGKNYVFPFLPSSL